MALQTFVSFESDFPTDSRPPGRELVLLVSTKLTEAGLPHNEPTPRGDWAWTIFAERTLKQVEIVIGKVEDGDHRWLITLDAHVSLAFGLVGGENADEVREETLKPFCNTLDRALRQDSRFRDVRWFTQKEYDAHRVSSNLS